MNKKHVCFDQGKINLNFLKIVLILRADFLLII